MTANTLRDKRWHHHCHTRFFISIRIVSPLLLLWVIRGIDHWLNRISDQINQFSAHELVVVGDVEDMYCFVFHLAPKVSPQAR